MAFCCLFSFAIFPQNTVAQIIPDATLPQNSIVIPSGNTWSIEGGTTVGGNLFHSLQEFSVPTGSEAFFKNSLNLDNIITRVTGGEISQIDGLLRANGTANLFLINPSGIAFGPNAQLNLGGSFFASTADRILFQDGVSFSAKHPENQPLLTVNVPVGLQYGSSGERQAGNIAIDRSMLQVLPDRTLALLGGNVTLNGASLKAPGSQVILGGLTAEGEIDLSGNTVAFPNLVNRGTVVLDGGASVDVRGSQEGGILVESHDLALRLGSQLLAGNFLDSRAPQTAIDSGDIAIYATGTVTLRDRSLILNSVSANTLGNGGNIDLFANAITLNSGSRIATVTESWGNAGNILLNADAIEISGFTNDGLFSGILSHSATENSGQSGTIQINSPANQTGTIHLADRGFIATVTNSNALGGDVEVNAANVFLERGGQILTLTTSGGAAGTITLNAAESITLEGSSTQFIPSPFKDIPVFNLDALPFSTELDPTVEASGSGGIPYISVQRTPDSIVSGNTILGTSNNGFDYYSFSITQPNSRGIFDIDGGDGYSQVPGSLDTEIVLFNAATGEILASNDDAQETLGGSGSIVNQDSYISTTFSTPGTYVVGVGEFDAISSSLNLLEGDRVDRGDTYTLQISLENQGTEIAPLLDLLNPENFNPNYGGQSGLVSVTEGSGNTGNLILNTPAFRMQPGAEITATTFAGGNVGDITLHSNAIDIQNANLSNITRGSGDAGSIFVNAETINLSQLSTFNVSSLGQGNTGDIRIDATQVQLSQGSSFDIGTYDRGNSGNVIINARESVTLDGELDRNRSHIFNIVAGPSAMGNAGEIQINTRQLFLTNGASLNTTTYGEGNAGDITIHASESVILDRKSSNGNGSDLLSRVRARAQGNAGDISVTTPFFAMTNGARIFNRTEGRGNAGDLTIAAAEIQLSGSEIGSSVEPGAIGNGGTISLRSDRVSLSDLAKISASSSGQGDAGQIAVRATDTITLSNSTISTAIAGRGQGLGGSLMLEADSLTLRDRAFLTAETVSGQGGNIRLQLNTLLQMQGNSQISATAGTAGVGGDGGNIEIDSPLIVALPAENSDITANAFQGAGGNIRITTQGLFGLQFRSTLTNNNDITASSQFGVSGTVAINNPDVNTSAGLVALADAPIDASQQVLLGCAAARENSFTITGRGGLPEDPTGTLHSQTVWEDWQDLASVSEVRGESVPHSRPPEPQTRRELVEATSWRVREDGVVELVARRPVVPQSWTRASQCRP